MLNELSNDNDWHDSHLWLPKCQLPTCVTRKCNLVCFMFLCQIESRPTNRRKWLVAATGAMYPCAKKFWGSKKKPPPTAWVIHCLRNFLPASRTQRDNAHMTSAKLWSFFIPSPASVLNPVTKILMSFFWANPFNSDVTSLQYLAIPSPNVSPWPGFCHHDKK